MAKLLIERKASLHHQPPLRPMHHLSKACYTLPAKTTLHHTRKRQHILDNSDIDGCEHFVLPDLGSRRDLPMHAHLQSLESHSRWLVPKYKLRPGLLPSRRFCTQSRHASASHLDALEARNEDTETPSRGYNLRRGNHVSFLPPIFLSTSACAKAT